MYAKLLIKFYVVIFGISLAIGGVMTNADWMIYLSGMHIIALFVILFQHSNLFVGPQEERVLFAPDVFAFLAVRCGVAVGALIHPLYSSVVPSLRVMMLLIGGFFYITTVWLFRMFDHQSQRAHWTMNTLAGLMIIAFVLVEAGRLYTSHGELIDDYSDAVSAWSWNTFDRIDLLGNSQPREIPPMDDLPVAAEDREATSDETQEATEQDSEEESIDLELAVSDQAADEPLTYGSFLPALQQSYDLPIPEGDPSFTYVSQTNELYEPFAAAYSARMIGTNTNPASQLRCGNLMVLLGLAERWNITYTANTVIQQFWQEAVNRGYTQAGCTDPNQLATWSDIP